MVVVAIGVPLTSAKVMVTPARSTSQVPVIVVNIFLDISHNGTKERIGRRGTHGQADASREQRNRMHWSPEQQKETMMAMH